MRTDVHKVVDNLLDLKPEIVAVLLRHGINAYESASILTCHIGDALDSATVGTSLSISPYKREDL